MQKPLLAPKPKFVQPPRQVLSPSTLRRDGLLHPSPATPTRVKPALAPKPCLSKLTTAMESKPLSSKSLHQTSVSEKTEIQRTIGLLNSKNGMQQENKKPDWDYIIPICLCSQENCQCVGNTADLDKIQKDLKISHKGKMEESRKTVPRSPPVPRSQGSVDNTEEKLNNAKCQNMNANCLQNICPQPACTNTHISDHKPVQEVPVPIKRTEMVKRNLNPDIETSSLTVSMRPSLPHRTWSDEANGNVTALSAVGQGPAEDQLGSKHVSHMPHPNPTSVPIAPRKPLPAPVPRKPRKAALVRQEKVEENSEEIVSQEGRGINVKEVKMSLEGKSSSSLSVSVPVAAQDMPVSENRQTLSLYARKASAPPAPPPKKKPLLSAPARATPTSSPQSLQQDVEEDLGCDTGIYEMELSVDDDEGDDVGKDGAGRDNREVVYSSLTSPFSQPDLSCYSASGRLVEDGTVKLAPKKPQRHSNPVVWMLRKEASVDREEGEFADDDKMQARAIPDGTLKERVMRELPLAPDEKANRSLLPAVGSPGPTKPSRSSVGKQRAKSFSAADLTRSEGQRRNSFRKLLDLKLSVKMLPKLIVKGGQRPDCLASETEQCVDGDQDGPQDFTEHLGIHTQVARKSSCPPHIGVEQSVDGDDFSQDMEQALEYENIPHYEEIQDYMNVPMVRAMASPQAMQPPAWETSMYDDENIYEEQEPYVPLEKNTGHQQKHSGNERGSGNEEEEAQLDDVPSDDDIIMSHSSDEEDEDDGSSTSSKGDSEQPQARATESGMKKSKIHHIATEIMSSENVFVDVLKLLHIDFRDAVSKASQQSGKPVIEERILNQILYYLPQLYELNQDLLRELEQRVAKWDENAQLADIFVKKGPYLKMYSTYIREFDKNAALLEEQSKRNPAFAGVVREFEASPRCANLALKHYLLKPVQRIPQYQLLLTDYLKNLPPDSVDYKDTQAALGIVKEVANHANDIMKHGDNFQKLIQVQCSLNGHHQIVQPGRVFLKEGILMKLSRKVMQPRMFFLLNDTLLYTTPVQLGQYKLNNMLSLAGMKVSKPSQEAYQNELNIESVERSFILSASSATERDEWLEAISVAISDYTKKKISFIAGKTLDETEPRDRSSGAPLGSKAPIWIPDPRATMCMICTCDFTLTWRRHHCRACGKVVCQSCSSNKHCLEYLKNRLARVCDQCFVVLQQQKSEQAQSPTPSPGNRSAFAFSRKQKKIPAALKEVTANTDNSSMSGYLQRSNGKKKQGKRLWFVIKDKVLYTYAASEDVAALESQPLLGFILKEDSSQKLQFKLYHKNTLYYIFKADDIQTAQRWIDTFKGATVL
ncbi:FYVE, RhoGEF and PH domain-containing protein 6-like [Myripristis murdjan]|uniref:FYVE, RhoGEF and PH domain-containing protein 6-like n=1 Tax=Myripristis murdjan TaxID=586833 RepID=UPI0011762567|nr:FYVE, RhoGEF and PH domain-containing protein 6-like [Myripristis murdjan]